MSKTREIKYRQPIFNENGHVDFHYWGTYMEQGGEMANVGWLSFRLGVTNPRQSQQYTGLKDRFGKEIYEGDIVRLFSTEDNHPILDGEIKFIYGSWRITETISLFSNDRNCEIIGNIFESAENEVHNIMKKQKQIEALSECIVVELTVQCEKCRSGEMEGFTDEDDFADKLYNKGWRYKNEMCLCPKCVKTEK